MLPIKDDNPSRRTPIVTYTIILINGAVFLYETALSLSGDLPSFFRTYALIPANITNGTGFHTLITSMFLHGGVMHITGNMLYLYIFGDNIEDIVGRFKFIIFYILSGLGATAAQIWVNPYSTVPNLGASGAVAGVLGAYFVTYPHARVHCIIIFGYFIRWITLPAIYVLGFWFIIQLFTGVTVLPQMSSNAGGVAYFAHIGGFITGMALIHVFKERS